MVDMNSNSKMSIIDEELSSTEIGQFISKYKIQVVGLIIMIFLGIIGWGVTTQIVKSKNAKLTTIIHQFEKNSLGDLKNNKLNKDEYLDRFNQLLKETGSYNGTLSVSIKTADFFIEKNQLEDAKNILIQAEKNLDGNNPFVDWFLYNRLAVVYEDLGQVGVAIKYLKKMSTSSIKLLNSKVYLDLGRLYLKQGNKEDAVINLKYVVDQFGDSSFAKIAKLYLNDIN